MKRPQASAGLLLYRWRARRIEVLLVHPGGPFWQKRDAGAWSLPKGFIDEGEEWLAAACREFEEETGWRAEGPFIALGSVRQKSGKIVHAWAFEGDCDPSTLSSNLFEIEWPPRSGKKQSFPEVDRAEFFSLERAREKLNPAQTAFLDRLAQAISGESSPR